MRCPNCNEESFVVDYSELNIAELYLEAEVQCDKCGKEFNVSFGLKVEEIREVD